MAQDTPLYDLSAGIQNMSLADNHSTWAELLSCMCVYFCIVIEIEASELGASVTNAKSLLAKSF